MAQSTSVSIVDVKTGLKTGTHNKGNRPLLVRARAFDAQGNPNSARVILASSNRNVAQVTTPDQINNDPAGIVGVAPGVCNITATAEDNSGATDTFVVTVQ